MAYGSEDGAPKPTNSTPSHAGTHGPDVARSPSIPATSHTHSIATSSPVENRGWQDVEEMQQRKVLDALENAINTNRQTFSGMPQAPIDYLWKACSLCYSAAFTKSRYVGNTDLL